MSGRAWWPGAPKAPSANASPEAVALRRAALAFANQSDSRDLHDRAGMKANRALLQAAVAYARVVDQTTVAQLTGLLTADTITDDHVRALRAHLIQVKRPNAYVRAILKDCDGALKGDRACLESCAMTCNRRDRRGGSL